MPRLLPNLKFKIHLRLTPSSSGTSSSTFIIFFVLSLASAVLATEDTDVHNLHSLQSSQSLSSHQNKISWLDSSRSNNDDILGSSRRSSRSPPLEKNKENTSKRSHLGGECLCSLATELKELFLKYERLILKERRSPTLKTKQTRIAFLKTHKTASSTLGSIFFRFGARNHLRIYSQGGANYHVLDVYRLDPTQKIKHLIQNVRSAQKYYSSLITSSQTTSSSKDADPAGQNAPFEKPTTHPLLLKKLKSLKKKENELLKKLKEAMFALGNDNVTETSVVPADLCIHHVSAPKMGLVYKFDQLLNFYNDVIPNPAFVTIIRSPLSHSLSYYNFFIEPDNLGQTFEEYLSKMPHPNLQLLEFGVSQSHVKEQVEAMRLSSSQPADLVSDRNTANMALEREVIRRIVNKTSFILVTDRIDESLVAMMLYFNWTLADITYVPLLDSHTNVGALRWDGKPIKPTPKVEDMSSELVSLIQEKTKYDFILFEEANKRLDDLIDLFGSKFNKTLVIFRKVQANLKTLCECSDQQSHLNVSKEETGQTHNPFGYGEQLVQHLKSIINTKDFSKEFKFDDMLTIISNEHEAINSKSQPTGEFLKILSNLFHGSVKALCAWYRLTDLEYERLVSLKTGYVNFAHQFSSIPFVDPYFGL